MESNDKWYFTKKQLENTPSRKCGCDADKELSFRQQAANFLQDMGQRLLLSQLCINTAIVYMHRFYVFHSFTLFHRNAIAVASLFLAAKVEEQPRRLEQIIKVAHLCLNWGRLDKGNHIYLQQGEELVIHENILLQTLGFDVAIDHAHTHIVRFCHLVNASKDLSRASYFLASNSLHLTTMCLQYKPTLVACFCIHLACKWSNVVIPQSREGKEWYSYIDKTATPEKLDMLSAEFLNVVDKCPTKLKRRMESIKTSGSLFVKSNNGKASHLKRRRKCSPCSAGDSSGNEHKEIYDPSLPPNSFNNADVFQNHFKASTTTKNNSIQEPSTSYTYDTLCKKTVNSHPEISLQKHQDRMKTHSVEFTREFLDHHATKHIRDLAANNLKRLKIDVIDDMLDHISKQRIYGTNEYFDTNLHQSERKK